MSQDDFIIEFGIWTWFIWSMIFGALFWLIIGGVSYLFYLKH